MPCTRVGECVHARRITRSKKTTASNCTHVASTDRFIVGVNCGEVSVEWRGLALVEILPRPRQTCWMFGCRTKKGRHQHQSGARYAALQARREFTSPFIYLQPNISTVTRTAKSCLAPKDAAVGSGQRPWPQCSHSVARPQHAIRQRARALEECVGFEIAQVLAAKALFWVEFQERFHHVLAVRNEANREIIIQRLDFLESLVPAAQ